MEDQIKPGDIVLLIHFQNAGQWRVIDVNEGVADCMMYNTTTGIQRENFKVGLLEKVNNKRVDFSDAGPFYG